MTPNDCGGFLCHFGEISVCSAVLLPVFLTVLAVYNAFHPHHTFFRVYPLRYTGRMHPFAVVPEWKAPSDSVNFHMGISRSPR